MVSKLITSVILFSILRNAASFNPDSEIVQDPAESSRQAGKKSLPKRALENRPTVAVISDGFSSGVKVLRPIFTDIGIIWREVGSAAGEDRIRIRDRGSFLDVFSLIRNNRTGSFMPSRGLNGKPDSPDVTSQPVTIPPPNIVPAVKEGNSSSGTFEIPLYINNGASYASNIHGRSYGNLPGRRGYSVYRPYFGNRNRQIPFPAGNVPLNQGKNVIVNPSGGNRVPGVSPNPQNTRNNESPSATDNKKIPPDSNLFAGMVNDFTFKLVKALNLESNFVVSPLSLFAALAMVYLGSQNRTKAQLEQALGLDEFSVHDAHLHHGISDLLSMISPQSNEYQLLLANGMFLGKNFTVEQPFKEEIQKFYNAELKNIDFNNQQQSLRDINEWVSKNTNNMIDRIIGSAPPAFTRLILLNAIYFKGIWKTQFRPDSTENGQFFSLDGKEKEVPLMNMNRVTFPVFRSDEHRHSFIKLPYQGDQVSMIIALPYRLQEQPMPEITDQMLCHIRDAMEDRVLNSVTIPKFRLEHMTPLRGPLMQLGIRDIFGGADFGKMRKQNDVYVTDILQKAVIDVNEVGTTAAGATAVQLVPLSSYTDDFVANHPFAFYIVHEPSGLVLFYGKIYDLGESPKAPTDNRQESMRVPQSNRREMPQASNNRRLRSPQS